MSLSRRRFLHDISACTASALALPPHIQQRMLQSGGGGSVAARVRGRVVSGKKGIARAAVSDGRQVVTSDRNGYFELLADAESRYVQLSLPSGFRIPTMESGAARIFQPLAPDRRGEMNVTFGLEPELLDDTKHSLLLLADPQTQNRYETGLMHAETLPAMMAAAGVRSDVPVFGIGCGDLMFDDHSLYPEYELLASRSGIPLFQVVGNHDMNYDARTDDASTRTWESHFGPTWYSFNRGEIHYVALDDVFWHGDGYIGYIPATQLAWLQRDLATVEAGRTVVVATHIPLASTRPERNGNLSGRASERVNNRQALYELLAPYQAHVLTGHTHENEHIISGNVHEHVHGTTCGAWWSGPICWDGTPRGFGVYDVRGSELRWQYQATGLAADHQLRVYQAGADPQAPEAIVANVWNWDPEWTVVYYEGADRRGPMLRRRGLDPLSVKLHTGPDLPTRRTWVEPTPTDHLFYAPGGGREIRVEATDRFGRTYSAVPVPV